jgi:hypothetical protein
MSGIRKSTDFGLTNAERKSLRECEAKEAMSDRDDVEKAFHGTRDDRGPDALPCARPSR